MLTKLLLALHILFPFPALRSPRHPHCLFPCFLQVPTQMSLGQRGFLTPVQNSSLALLYGVEHCALLLLALTLITWLSVCWSVSSTCCGLNCVPPHSLNPYAAVLTP